MSIDGPLLAKFLEDVLTEEPLLEQQQRDPERVWESTGMPVVI